MPARTDFQPGEFCWVDLNAHDLDAAAGWYGELFGWTRQDMPTPGGGPPYAFFLQGASPAAGIGQMSDEMKAQGIPPMWNSYICVDDCAASEQRVAELGGTVTVPTMEVPGNGKLCFLLDPEGGSVAMWQSTGGGEAPGMWVSEPVGLCWNELMCRDTAQAKAFYGALCGWEFADMEMAMEGCDPFTYTMLKVGDKDAGGMMAMEGPQFEGVPTHWMAYFAVADCAATADQVGATGGSVRVPPTPIPVGTFSVVSDPQGAVFSVITLNQPPG